MRDSFKGVSSRRSLIAAERTPSPVTSVICMAPPPVRRPLFRVLIPVPREANRRSSVAVGTAAVRRR